MEESTRAPPSSQFSPPHHPIEPLPASRLLDQDLARKEALAGKGCLLTGCGELDDYVLLGGFERGSVVGVSAEEEEVGMLIGLQTVAHLLTADASARAMVVTTLPATVLLPKLRTALVGQVSVLQGGLRDLQARVKGCLERIAIARVFDMEGLEEVLGELEGAVSEADARLPPLPVREVEAGQKPDRPAKEEAKGQRQQRTEVLDSEDEGGLSSPEPSSPPQNPPPQPDTYHTPATKSPEDTPSSPALPDVILITHTSTLLNALFTGRDQDAAHNTMHHLASRLHTLTRPPSHPTSGPLVMFLNSTTSPSTSSAHHTDPPGAGAGAGAGGGGRGGEGEDRHHHLPPQKQPDPTLRSIFNPPPPGGLPPSTTVAGQQQPGGHSFGSSASSAMRNKPYYGLVFSRMLDLHLLCTRVPRTRADRAALLADRECVWVVEVLLDEMGVYERDGEGGFDWGRRGRRSREQRWGVVDVDGEGRVVDGAGVGL